MATNLSRFLHLRLQGASIDEPIANLGGGGGGNTTTVQKSDPWSGVQPYLQNLFSRAEGAYNSGTLAQQNPYATQAAQQYANSAQGSLVGQAQQQLGATLGGDYLSAGANPYLQGAVQQALDQVKGNVNRQFSGDNFGSSANQEWLAKSLANTALPIYAQNYATERQNQLAATQAAPGLQSYAPGQLAQAAQIQQSQLDQPYTALQRYQGLVSGQGGASTTTTQPYFTNPLGGAIGGALAGSVFGPWGAAIGGGLGLLSGR